MDGVMPFNQYPIQEKESFKSYVVELAKEKGREKN